MTVDLKALLSHVRTLEKVYPDDFVPSKDVPKFDLPQGHEVVGDVTILSPERFRVSVKNIKQSATYSLQVKLSDTILSLKERIQHYCGNIGPEYQRLLVAGKVLTDSKTVSDYDQIEPNATLSLMLRSGAKPTQCRPRMPGEEIQLRPPMKTEVSPAVASGPEGAEVQPPQPSRAFHPDFWEKLGRFLSSELEDKGQADRLLASFREWYTDVPRNRG